MAKHLVQFILAGAQIVTRAFANAVRQEIRMSQEAAKRHSGGQSKNLKQLKNLWFVLKFGDLLLNGPLKSRIIQRIPTRSSQNFHRFIWIETLHNYVTYTGPRIQYLMTYTECEKLYNQNKFGTKRGEKEFQTILKKSVGIPKNPSEHSSMWTWLNVLPSYTTRALHKKSVWSV